jgi:NAD(P)-dependent dehydrogenase (short-subunit alcohol dehydrogenase family)
VSVSISVYPIINPAPHFSAKTYRDKVVLITGGSRGIGAETALMYARAGASVAILVRWQNTLDKRAAEICSVVPGAQVLVITADVRNSQAVDACSLWADGRCHCERRGRHQYL